MLESDHPHPHHPEHHHHHHHHHHQALIHSPSPTSSVLALPFFNTDNPLANYSFPHDRLTRTMHNPHKEPVVLVACGSFSPVTYLHLRMFEMALDYARQNTNFEIVGAYLSPVSDKYRKPGLLSAKHRVAMCMLAAQRESNRLMVDPWEAFQDKYQRTAIVLDHFDNEINDVLGGVRAEYEDGRTVNRRVRVMLLAGSDLIATMSEPGVWSQEDLDHILGKYGAMIVERAGTDMLKAVESLSKWRDNIYLISQMIQNDVSSTKVRQFLRRGLSVRYLLPKPVIDYIEENGLYLDEGPNSANGSYLQMMSREKEREKDKDKEDKDKDGKGVNSGSSSSSGSSTSSSRSSLVSLPSRTASPRLMANTSR